MQHKFNPQFHRNDQLFNFSTTSTEMSKCDSSHGVIMCKNNWNSAHAVGLTVHHGSTWALLHRSSPVFPRRIKQKKRKITLGRSVHSGQFSDLGWKLRTLGPISWFHFCCSQNPSPSSSTWWTEDLGGSILICLKPATRSRKDQTPWHGFKQEHTVHLCKQLNQQK